MTLVPRPIGRGLKANKKFLPYLGWFCFSRKADHGYREQETSFRFKKRYRYTVHVMASWAHPTKNRAKIRNRFIAHLLSADSCVRAIYEVRLCCIWFLKIRLLYILGLDNCKAGVQKWEMHFHHFPKHPKVRHMP